VRRVVTEAAAVAVAGSVRLAGWAASDSVTTLCPSTLPTWPSAERRMLLSPGVAESRSRLRFRCSSRDRRSRPGDGVAGAEEVLIGAEVRLGVKALLRCRRMVRPKQV
jgi:hypothetical protein